MAFPSTTTKETTFRHWYANWAARTGIDLDPDNPAHKYDYRAAYKAGVSPELSREDNLYHWPSRFKADDHPNRFVNGVDTKVVDQATSTRPPGLGSPNQEPLPDSSYATWVRGNVAALRQAGRADTEIADYLRSRVGLADPEIGQFLGVEPTGPLNLPPAARQVVGAGDVDPLVKRGLDPTTIMMRGLDPLGLAGALGIQGPNAGQHAVGAAVTAARGFSLGATDWVPGLREIADKYREERPGSAFGLELLSARYNPLAYGLGIARGLAKGASAGAKFVRGLAEVAQPTHRAKTVVGAAAKSAAGGGLYGTTYGFNTSQGDPASMAGGGLAGTFLGGTLGTLIRPLENFAFRAAEGSGAPTGRAGQWMVNAFEKDRALAPAPGMFGPHEVALDQGATALKGLVNEAASRSPVANNKLQAFVKERTQVLKDGVGQMANAIAGIAPPVGRKVANVELVAQQLGREAQEKAAPLYAALERANPLIPVDDDLAALLHHPKVTDMLWGRKAAEFSKGRVIGDIAREMTGQPTRGLGITPARLRTPQGPQFAGTFDWRRLDLLKKQIDDQLMVRGEQALVGQARSDLVAVQTALLGMLDAKVPGYAAARAAFAGPKSLQKMLQEGSELGAKGADKAEAFMATPEFASATPLEQRFFRLGLLANLQKQIGNESRPADAEFWNPIRVRLLQLAAENSAAADGVPGFLAVLAHKDETLRGLSTRAGVSVAREAEAGRSTAAQIGTALAVGRPGLAARATVTGVGSYVRPMQAKEAESIMEWLLEKPVIDVADYLQRFKARGQVPTGLLGGFTAGR